jgi:hypothetical protein
MRATGQVCETLWVKGPEDELSWGTFASCPRLRRFLRPDHEEGC